MYRPFSQLDADSVHILTAAVEVSSEVSAGIVHEGSALEYVLQLIARVWIFTLSELYKITDLWMANLNKCSLIPDT